EQAASTISRWVTFLLMSPQSYAADLDGLVSSPRCGSCVIVVRRSATDDSRRTSTPFKFDDMTAQRQPTEKGRNMARVLGEALRELALPIGVVCTSRLGRAVEIGRLLTGKEMSPVDALTDSGAGSSLAVADLYSKKVKAGGALRDLVNVPPKAG